jgi:hypothetical protein
VQVRATGGGAFKFAELFKERLGVMLKKEDEISCLVDGCSFLLKAIRNEAFEFQDGEYSFKSNTTGPCPALAGTAFVVLADLGLDCARDLKLKAPCFFRKHVFVHHIRPVAC